MQVEPLPASADGNFAITCSSGRQPVSAWWRSILRSGRRFLRSRPPHTAGRADCARRRGGPTRASPRSRSARRRVRYRTGAGSRGSRRRQQTAQPATRRFPPAADHPARPRRQRGRRERDPLDTSIAGDDEPVTDRVDVPERAVDPGNPVDVDREGGNAGVLVGALKSATAGIPFATIDPCRGAGTGSAHPDPRAAPAAVSTPRQTEAEVPPPTSRRYPRLPSRRSRSGSPTYGTGIVRGTAADHACPVEVDHLTAELARIAPVMGPLRDARRVEKVVWPASAIGRPVVRPGLQ